MRRMLAPLSLVVVSLAVAVAVLAPRADATGGTYLYLDDTTWECNDSVAQLASDYADPNIGYDVNELQTLAVSATGGTYTLTYNNEQTAPIVFDASSSTVRSALQALNSIGNFDVGVSGGVGDSVGGRPYHIEFRGNLAGQDVDAITTDATSLTGGSGTAVVTTTLNGENVVASGSGLPLKVTMRYASNYQGQGVNIGRDCMGDPSSSAVDLFVFVRGDGETYGPRDDALRVLNYAPTTDQSLVISGALNCGGNPSFQLWNSGSQQYTTVDYHQDGIQAISGNGITFKNMEVGDYDNGIATCAGGGGALFFSRAGANAPVDMNVDGGKFIACNHAVIDGGTGTPRASGSITDASFRSHRYYDAPGASTNLCRRPLTGFAYVTGANDLSNPDVTETNITEQYWDDVNDVWVTQ